MDRKLVFYGILDFFPRKDEIKEIYDNLSFSEKKIYKMYVYSICFEREYTKDLIWEYLNGWEEGQFELAKEWRLKKKKMEQRLKYENSNTNEII